MELIIFPSQAITTRPTSVAQNKTTRHQILHISFLEIVMRLA